MEIKREKYLNQLISSKHNHLVKVITGLRRVGKSYLLFTIFKEHLLSSGVQNDHIIEMSFDDFAVKKFRNPEIFYDHIVSKIVDDGIYYILLDEVQLLEDFVDVLNGLLRKPNLDVYVTGSNSRFLSSDIVTEFRGRGDQLHLSPLSFKDYMEIFIGDIFSAWTKYMRYGGLPMVVLAEDNQKKEKVLKELIKETYLNDIKNRNRIHNDAELEDIFFFLSSNIGALTNPHKLSNTFQSEKGVSISSETIKRYIDYFIDSFLISRTQRYDVKGKKYIDTPHKYYFTDVGLRNSIIDFRQLEPTHIMENIIYNELISRGYNVDIGTTDIFEKQNGKTVRKTLEIDFVANKGGEKMYIQSALSLPDEDKLKQEQHSLLAVNDNFPKTIITADPISSYVMDNGIKVQNLFEFLLNDSI